MQYNEVLYAHAAPRESASKRVGRYTLNLRQRGRCTLQQILIFDIVRTPCNFGDHLLTRHVLLTSKVRTVQYETVQ